MAFKFFVFCAILATARAGHQTILAAPAPLAYAAPLAKVAEPYDPHPQYSFGYDIQDGLSGDVKSQQEQRSGDVVQGSYSLVEPDGTRRIVDYVADPVNGFNAVVRKEPLGVKAAVVTKIAQPLAYAQPAQLVHKIAQPIAYAQPAAQIVQKIAQPIAYAQPAHIVQQPISYAQPLVNNYH